MSVAENGRTDEGGPEVVLEKALAALKTDDDRTILTLWLADWPLFRIAEAMGSRPVDVRLRWQTIRELLKKSFDAGKL